jgi:hypothetical protein
MNTKQFLELQSMYGVDIERWPQQWQAKARELAAQPGMLSSEEAAMDTLLASVPVQRPDVALTDRILRSFAPFERVQSFQFSSLISAIFGSRRHAMSLAMAASLLLAVLGGAGGFFGADILFANEGGYDLVSTAFGEEDFDPETSTVREIGT